MLDVSPASGGAALDSFLLPAVRRLLPLFRGLASAGKTLIGMETVSREVGSGAVAREQRQQLIDAARRREIDVVLVWRLDRWDVR